MNWLTDYVKPTLESLIGEKREVPEDLWTKCPNCSQMLFKKDLDKSLHVCRHCGHHMRITAKQRLGYLFDQGQYESVPIQKVPHDPLRFKDQKSYADRLKAARSKTGEHDAIQVGEGSVEGQRMVIAAFDFSFMGGSMGMYVGEGLVQGAKRALAKKLPYLVIPASGGARMQEGILSLMQMPRSIIAIQQLKEAGLPYLVLLTDPTTGGVSASFAMVGDVAIAEPRATIGFTGARVIKETIREELPEGFQTSEYLYEHGQLDMVVNREDLPRKISQITTMLMQGRNKVGSRKQ